MNTSSITSVANSLSKQDDISTRSKELNGLAEQWAMITALIGGTTAMRAAGDKYLPQFKNELDDSYNKRLATSTLFPAFKRTVVTLAARPFSKPVTVDDSVPPQVKALFGNIDLQGNNLDAFMAETFRPQMAYGMIGLLVEHPKRPADAKTQADDKRYNLRPYFVRVFPEQLLGWRLTLVGGAFKLTQLRIMEQVQEPDGDYGLKMVQQVRLLEPGKWSTHRKNEASGLWLMVDEGLTSLEDIPFVMLYGERTGFMLGKSPLLELAHLNVKHWQQQSDQDALMHVARVPILTVRGVDADFVFTIGAGTAVNLKDNPDAEMRFVEHTGSAIGAGKEQLDDLKEEMRQSGAELLVLRPGPTTATEIASDNAVGMCALQEMALSTEDGLNQALLYAAQYMRLTDGGKVTLFKDFGAATLAEASAQLLVAMANAGKLSFATLINELKRRGILSADVDPDTEAEAVAAEGPPEPPVGKIDPLTGLPYTEPVPPTSKKD